MISPKMQFVVDVEPIAITEDTPARCVMDTLNVVLRRVWPEEERFGWSWLEEMSLYGRVKAGVTWWEVQSQCRLAVYCLEGESEGHYIHVDILYPDTDHGVLQCRNLMLQKTWGGLARAQAIANLVQFLLTGGRG